MNELERLVVALIAALEANGIKMPDEVKALNETVGARCESAVDYHLTRRGVDALERRTARDKKRDIDYPKARELAAAKHDGKERN